NHGSKEWHRADKDRTQAASNKIFVPQPRDRSPPLSGVGEKVGRVTPCAPLCERRAEDCPALPIRRLWSLKSCNRFKPCDEIANAEGQNKSGNRKHPRRHRIGRG